MKRTTPKIDYIYLKPGELACSKKPAVISTILGSCVSIILYTPRIPLGCMCHAVLPDSKGRPGAKFVDRAIAGLLKKLERLDVDRADLVVKLFGGAETLPYAAGNEAARTIAVGHQNIAAALEAIARAGLQLTASDVGGYQGRKIVFYSHTGEVFLKKIKLKGADSPVFKSLCRDQR